tara:strand:+ start:1207 stop:1437 length:231 start_codon:yes stop_codon:yes gene_type:complete
MKKIIKYFKEHPTATAIFITAHVPLFVGFHGLKYGTMVFAVFILLFIRHLLKEDCSLSTHIQKEIVPERRVRDSLR